jgi:hypothetical protein
MREGLFYYVKHYNLDKYIKSILRAVIFIGSLWVFIVIFKKLNPILISLNIDLVAYWWIYLILIAIMLLGMDKIYDKLDKILKEKDITTDIQIDKGKFLKEKWAFYPSKWYILWILIFINIYLAFFLQFNGILSLPPYINKILIYGIFISIFELIPIKIKFYENGIGAGSGFYPYKQVKILEKKNRKIILINNILMYILFDKNKNINYILGLNSLKNILIESR